MALGGWVVGLGAGLQRNMELEKIWKNMGNHGELRIPIRFVYYVWKIYLQNCVIYGVNVGKYDMEHLG